MKKISKYFYLNEFFYSEKAIELGIDNTTNDKNIIANIKALAEVLDSLRACLKRPLKINSGYRCAELNKVVGGVATSQHTKGEAADIHTGSCEESYKLAKTIIDLNLPYDQLILYPTFVHISHKRTGTQRKQLLYNKSSYKGKKL